MSLLSNPSPSPRLNQVQQPSELADFSAIALFLDRARAYRPNFSLTEDNIGAVISLCKRLDGLPLAIELAASRIKLMSASTILAQIERQPDFLRSDLRDRPSRQHTLHATIAWSYQLLSSTEQAVFASLAVFRGGFSAGAVAAVWKGDVSAEFDALDYLSILVNHSMIRVVESKKLGEARFDMLVTLREFAQQVLDESGAFNNVATAPRRSLCGYRPRSTGLAAQTKSFTLATSFTCRRDQYAPRAAIFANSRAGQRRQPADRPIPHIRRDVICTGAFFRNAAAL